MRFLVPRPERLVTGAAEQAYLAGAEGIPWESHNSLSDGHLIIERDTRESGYLYCPWKVAGRGLVQLCSGSLMERQKPYHMPVELARGTVNRARNQAALWESLGLAPPENFNELLQSAAAVLALAATSQEHETIASDYADEAIRLGLEAGDLLVREYARQLLTARRGSPGPGTVIFGARLEAPLSGDVEARFLAAANAVLIGLHWPEVEPRQGTFQWAPIDRLVHWCQQHNLRLCMGPLLQMNKHSLPDWLFLDDDFEDVQASVLHFIAAVVQRYKGKVQLWHVAARMNQDGAFDFGEDQRLRLVVEAVDRVRAIDARTPLVVSFDQPWGEYIVRKDQELTPLHFADTLVRGDLGLSGVGMEINYGYWPGGTLPRDALEVSRLVDRWAQLGVPLMVFLSAPSSAAADPLARHPGRPLPDLRVDGPTPAWQHVLVQWLIPLLLAKQAVQGIIWDCWQDDHPHEMPNGGLYDNRGAPKPALQSLIELRREWLS
jgi:hypothetical protein